MAGANWLFVAGTAVISVFLAISMHVVLYSPISPLPLTVSSSSFTSNNLLQGIEKLGEGILKGPEDLCIDREGVLYTVTRDGWVVKMHRNGSWERWNFVGGSSLLGLALSSGGGVLVCDADKGLLKVGDEEVTLLASHVNGTRILFADDVIEASDGTVYFTDCSSKFGFKDWVLDYLEARPHGRLLKYDTNTKVTSEILSHMCFPNGVALSKDEDFLVVCETWMFRCLKHWLKGEKRGETEVFIDNLPGGPDNINLAVDGSFWIALLQVPVKLCGFSVTNLINRSPIAKQIIASFPILLKMVHPKGAAVVNVGSDGKIKQILDDSSGKVISFITSVVEFDGNLYFGSLDANFVGKLPLKTLA